MKDNYVISEKIKRKKLKIIGIILSCICFFSLVACNKNSKTDPSANDYTAPFQIYDSEEVVFGEKYTSLFAAIDEISISGKTDWTVKDNLNKEVFKKSARNNLFMYTDKGFFSQTVNTKEADEFLANNKNSYVINGSGSAYYGFSVTRMNDNKTETYGYEYNTGAYLYQFSKGGYRKVSQIVHLSESKLKLSENRLIPNNAYFFINTNGSGGACDMGLTSADEHNGKVYLFSFGFGNGFNVHMDLGTITEFKYDEQTKEYSGADDIYMEYVMDEFGTYLYAKNLSTGVELRCEELVAGSTLEENYTKTWKTRPFLQSTSLVPYLKLNGRNLWDARCGGYLTDVRYSDLNIYKIGEDSKKEFYPSSPDTYYGFAYANDCASYLEKEISGNKSVIHNINYN